jgi:hypothetical protein
MSHRLIRVLVFAQNGAEALNVARRLLVTKKIVGRWPESGAPFDGAVDHTYYTDVPAVFQVSTARFPCDDPRGTEHLGYSMEFVTADFKRRMKDLRSLVAKYSDEELFVADVAVPGGHPYPSDFQQICSDLAGCSDEGYLYSPWGNPITRIDHVQWLITDTDADHEGDAQFGDTDSLRIMSQPLWVVAFAAHY